MGKNEETERGGGHILAPKDNLAEVQKTMSIPNKQNEALDKVRVSLIREFFKNCIKKNQLSGAALLLHKFC